MTQTAQNLYRLVDGVLEEGLPFLASYLEKTIDRSIYITDNNGLICYPDMRDLDKAINGFIELPSFDRMSDYFYDKSNRNLYYKVQYQEIISYIIVQSIPAKMISHTLSILSESRLAIKCYFYKAADKNRRKLELELAEYLFLRSNKDIRDIVALDSSESYMAVIIEIDPENETDWKGVANSFNEYLNNTAPDIYSMAWQHCLILIIPAYLKGKDLKADKNAHVLSSIKKSKEMIEAKFNIVTSQGVGQIYPLTDLRKSYYEARIALSLPKLLGRRGFTQQFAELGIFSLIFSQQFTVIQEYCINTLGKLLKYDEMNNGDLLTTLRILLNNSVNWKATADDLFIHVNTLHYRINKIEELLDIDFSDMAARTNLFTAVTVWDILNNISYMN